MKCKFYYFNLIKILFTNSQIILKISKYRLLKNVYYCSKNKVFISLFTLNPFQKNLGCFLIKMKILCFLFMEIHSKIWVFHLLLQLLLITHLDSLLNTEPYKYGQLMWPFFAFKDISKQLFNLMNTHELIQFHWHFC